MSKYLANYIAKRFSIQFWLAIQLFNRKFCRLSNPANSRMSSYFVQKIQIIYLKLKKPAKSESMESEPPFWNLFSSVVLLCGNDRRSLKNILIIKLNSPSRCKIRVV